MKTFFRSTLVVLLALGAARGAPTFDETMQKAAVEYRQKAEQAAQELSQTRARIADEKAPLLKQIRAAEDRIVAAESSQTHIQTESANAVETRHKLLRQLDELRKTTTYFSTLARDGLKAARDGLAPGEDQFVGDGLQKLEKELDDASSDQTGQSAMDAAEFLLARTQQNLGGYRAEGKAVVTETNQVVPGTFAFVGPETYFRAAQGGAAGAVRPREGARFPSVFRLNNWPAESAGAFFEGRPGTMMADASGGKALRLNETRGNVWQHIQKGGAVAYAILVVGLLAVLMILQKLRDLRQMRTDTPATVGKFLQLVEADNLEEADRALVGLRRTTRELYAVGLRNLDQPLPIIEQRLQAVLLEQRLHYERRLPLLAVIATAAPLMGLLGTVVGMVKTFALITVFGTGNAGRLSSGISEVLVATELGLTVAIPTLVIHGFLAQRVHKNLALLERYALQFTTAVQASRFPVSETDGESVRA